MRKTILTLSLLIGLANATEVTLCQFKNGVGYANSKIICDNGKTYSAIQDIYTDGWKFKGNFNVKDEAYIVMEKN